MGSTDKFKITSAHKSFSDRQNDLLSKLNNIEKTTNVPTPQIADLRMKITHKSAPNSTINSSMKQYKKRESIFKKPDAPITKCLPVRRLPDHYKNPEKWTKYSLEDVSEVSDRQNKATALAFLKDLQKIKSTEVEDEEDMETSEPKRIEFRKSVKLTEDKEETVSFRGSKVVMPEYVVGQSNKSKTRKASGKSEKNKKNNELKLDHLQDLYEDDTE